MFPIETFRVTVSRLVTLLEQFGIRFHLTGGVTSLAWGEPRMTQDIDLVVDNAALTARLDDFLAALDKTVFLFDKQSISKAVASRGMFQLFDGDECLKLDVYARELIPGELDRSVMAVFTDLLLPIASRVDAAASKLVWIDKGSHKSRRDVRKILASASDEENSQLRKLAEELHLTKLLETVLAESDEIE